MFNTALHDLNIYTHELQKYKYIYINYFLIWINNSLKTIMMIIINK